MTEQKRRGRPPKTIEPSGAGVTDPTQGAGVQIRERSDAGITTDQAITMGLEGGDPRDPNHGKRPKRIPMRGGSNLGTGGYKLDEKNYYYHWFNEHPSKPGRVQSAEAAYYEFCRDEQGEKISRGTGGGTIYLMRLPMEYRMEDLALKKIRVERTMQEEAKLAPDEYAPTEHYREGGDSAITRSDNPYS